jgi:hypothetical protein
LTISFGLDVTRISRSRSGGTLPPHGKFGPCVVYRTLTWHCRLVLHIALSASLETCVDTGEKLDKSDQAIVRDRRGAAKLVV